MTSNTMIDLDAARRERECPSGLKVVLGGEDFTLPAELPLDVVDILISPRLGLMAVVQTALLDGSSTRNVVDAVMARFESVTALEETKGALTGMVTGLFGDQWDRFAALRPTVQDMAVLVQGLLSKYGVGLGELFASLVSSPSGGGTSSTTSSTSTESTPGTSGGTTETSEPGFSGSAG
jgi:hypothetical protein